MEKDKDAVLSLMQGAYDLHIHTQPSHFQRLIDDSELVRQAEEYGMAGVMIKSHYEPTGARAVLLNQSGHFQTKAYGGVALNWPVGGINPYAAESALKMGATMIWMPTRDSLNCLQFGNMEGDFFQRPGLSIYNEEEKILPEVYDVMDVVKKYDAWLATGHLSAKESMVLCGIGRSRGVKMILTHPEWYRTKVPLEIQKELASLGVLIEDVWFNIADGSVTAQMMAEHIRELGMSHVYMATDRGQAGTDTPAQSMYKFISAMLEQGLTKEEIDSAVRKVPKQIVS